MATDPVVRRLTLDDLAAAEAAGRRAELVNGALVDKEAAGVEHGLAHGGVHGVLRGPFWGRGGPSRPGGWIFVVEPTILLPGGDTAAPDLAGWRIECPPTPGSWPVTPTPAWTCEIAYSSLRHDLVWKLERYRAAGVGHYWLLDVRDLVLTVYRLTPEGFLVALTAGPGDTVRAEPFDAVEVHVWELFGMLDPPA